MEKTDPLCRTQTSWETHQACHCPNIAFRVCVCVCCYLSILYILQRNAPACLHVTLVHPLKEEEAAAESYFLLGISLSISRFSFLPLSLRNFLSSSLFLPRFASCACVQSICFFCDSRTSNSDFFVCDRM